MLQTRLLAILCTFLTVTSSMVIQDRQVLPSSSSGSVSRSSTVATSLTTIRPSTTANPTETLAPQSTSLTATPSATPTRHFDDSGEYLPPPDPPSEYYEEEGAQGDSESFMNVSIAAQAGIIIAIVVIGLAIMAGCVWFWNQKKQEWKAAMERRRTLRASRRSMAANMPPGTPRLPFVLGAPPKKKNTGEGILKSAAVERKGSNSGSTNSAGGGVRVVEKAADVESQRSQFDVMTPTTEESPWWKRVLQRKSNA